jgi:hypothetical protein
MTPGESADLLVLTIWRCGRPDRMAAVAHEILVASRGHFNAVPIAKVCTAMGTVWRPVPAGNPEIAEAVALAEQVMTGSWPLAPNMARAA